LVFYFACKGTKSREQNKENLFFFCRDGEVSLSKAKNFAVADGDVLSSFAMKAVNRAMKKKRDEKRICNYLTE